MDSIIALDSPEADDVSTFVHSPRDLCQLKGRARPIRLIREDPSPADWWMEQKAKVPNRTGPDGRACESIKCFRLGETYAELKAAALADRDLFDQTASSAKSGDTDSFDCHCTD